MYKCQNLRLIQSSTIKRLWLKATAMTAALMLLTSLYYLPIVHAGTPVTVTVTILRVIETDCDEGAGEKCPNDLYAKVNIANIGLEQSNRFGDNTADVTPYATFSRTVDSDLGTVPIFIQVLDHDDLSDDDVVDIASGDGYLNLTLDLNTGSWSGDTPPNVGFSEGFDDESAKILFDISISGNRDFDGDGIPDGVERFGVRDGNGNLVANLAAMGADPCRPTIALEMDFMQDAAHSHRPLQAALNETVAAFNAAPVGPPPGPCPYAGFPTNNGRGINFIYEIDDALPEEGVLTPAGTMNPSAWRDRGEAIRNANFDAPRRPYFHYTLWAHDQRAGNSSSGLCCSDSGKDVLVTLGSWANSVGTVRDQSGTLMHELGHALGFPHGGSDGINCKPNYLSIMSYTFQVTGIPDSTLPANNVDLFDAAGNPGQDGVLDSRMRLDFSRSALPTLMESALVEANGIGDGTDLTFWRVNGAGNTQSAAGNLAIDWDGDNPANIDAGVVSVDLNNFGFRECGQDNNGVSNSVAGETMNGYNDWGNLRYRAVLSPNAGFSPPTSEQEIDFNTAQVIKAQVAEALKPDPSVVITAAPDPVVTGSNVTYTITLRNNRPTPATNVVVTSNLPASTALVSCAATGGVCGGAGNTITASFSQLAGNASQTITIAARVDCAVADLASISNTVTVTSATPDANLNNNSATATFTASNPPPVISCPANINVGNDPGVCSASLDPGTPKVIDNNNCPVTVKGVRSDGLVLSAPYPVGTTTITWTATDSGGLSASCTQTVIVRDVEPPVISGEAVDRPVLGPANHKMVDVTVNYTVTDNCDPLDLITRTLSVTSNEPINGPGDGNTGPDIVVLNSNHVRLRAERSGNGSGRIYTITITATDSKGNSSSKAVTVSVPHDKGR